MSLTYHRSVEDCLEGKYQHLSRKLAPRSHILEVGCHTGYFSKRLSSLGHTVVGFETNESAAAQARAYGFEVVVGDIESSRSDADFEGKFDAVLFMDVLEHLRDPSAVLLRARRWLKPGGRLLCSGPNVAYWWVRKELALGRWNYGEAGIMDRTHLRFFTRDTWRKLFEDSGYRVVNLEWSEAMFPLERWLRFLPGSERLTRLLRQVASTIAPTWFATIFLIEVTPLETSQRLTRPA